jgi:glutaredoxin
MLVKALRNGLGMIIVFVSWLTQPKPIKRNEIDQAQAQEDTQGLALYQLYACPFCVKTRRAIHRLNITIEIRDIGKQTSYRQELEQQGGRVKVPCLRIEEQGEVRWMYESSDIVSYLDQRVA